MLPAAIVHLIGFPAAGKLTVARALEAAAGEAGHRFVVLDNHHTSNVLFAVLDIDGIRPLPPVIWDRVNEVRAILFRTIEELSPPEWSFVFTNVLTDDRASERAAVDQLAELAARTARRYVPVVLQCDIDTLLQRVEDPRRRERHKWIDRTAVAEFVLSHALVDVDDLDPIVIDTATVQPDAAADVILRRLTLDQRPREDR